VIVRFRTTEIKARTPQIWAAYDPETDAEAARIAE